MNEKNNKKQLFRIKISHANNNGQPTSCAFSVFVPFLYHFWRTFPAFNELAPIPKLGIFKKGGVLCLPPLLFNRAPKLMSLLGRKTPRIRADWWVYFHQVGRTNGEGLLRLRIRVIPDFPFNFPSVFAIGTTCEPRPTFGPQNSSPLPPPTGTLRPTFLPFKCTTTSCQFSDTEAELSEWGTYRQGFLYPRRSMQTLLRRT